jgi:hypothetical protein
MANMSATDNSSTGQPSSAYSAGLALLVYMKGRAAIWQWRKRAGSIVEDYAWLFINACIGNVLNSEG